MATNRTALSGMRNLPFCRGFQRPPAGSYCTSTWLKSAGSRRSRALPIAALWPISRAPSPAEGKSRPAKPAAEGRVGGRSEEHTSELQSLMRISYAVFCLKKKNKQPRNESHRTAKHQNYDQTL